jgi:hypothetical protein
VGLDSSKGGLRFSLTRVTHAFKAVDPRIIQTQGGEMRKMMAIRSVKRDGNCVTVRLGPARALLEQNRFRLQLADGELMVEEGRANNRMKEWVLRFILPEGRV